jgi:transposase
VRERRRKFSPEFKGEAVKMVIESSSPIAEVAREIQSTRARWWVNRYRTDHAGEEPPLSMTERARLRELERENRELKMKAEFLGKAANSIIFGWVTRSERGVAGRSEASRGGCRA